MEHELPVVSGFPTVEEMEIPETFKAETIETFSNETIEVSASTSLKVSDKQPEIQGVSLKLSGEKETETFSRMDIETFVKTLDVSDLKTQMRNWYRRRMNTAENMAKYEAGRKVLLGLGIPVNEISKTRLSYK